MVHLTASLFFPVFAFGRKRGVSNPVAWIGLDLDFKPWPRANGAPHFREADFSQNVASLRLNCPQSQLKGSVKNKLYFLNWKCSPFGFLLNQPEKGTFKTSPETLVILVISFW